MAGLLQKLGAINSICLKLVAHLGRTMQLRGQAFDLGTPLLQLLLCRRDITLQCGQALRT
jgi:hypothetical protein